MSVSKNLNKFAFTNPSNNGAGRARAITISHVPVRPRSPLKKVHPHYHDTPLMIHTKHKMSHSAPCLPKSHITPLKSLHKAPGAPTHRRSGSGAGAAGARAHSPAGGASPRGSRKAGGGGSPKSVVGAGSPRTSRKQNPLKTKKTGSPRAEISGFKELISVTKPFGKVAPRPRGSKTRLRTFSGNSTHSAPGHSSISQAEAIHSFKDPPPKPELQNTLGGSALTSATPTALSAHMDPKMLQAAAGMAGMGFVATQMSQNEDQDHKTDTEVDSPADKVYDAAEVPPEVGELLAEEEGETLQYHTSELMRVTKIGENYCPAYTEEHATHPLLSAEHVAHVQATRDPLEQYHLGIKPPPPTEFYSTVNKGVMVNKGIYNTNLQYYDTTINDGMYCYSCIMFLGVLMIGVGIILIIVEIFGLFGHKSYLALIGGGVLLFGVATLSTAMLAWRRRRTYLKKKYVHV